MKAVGEVLDYCVGLAIVVGCLAFVGIAAHLTYKAFMLGWNFVP